MFFNSKNNINTFLYFFVLCLYFFVLFYTFLRILYGCKDKKGKVIYMALKTMLEPLVQKILDKASTTGYISENELIIILTYQKECNRKSTSILDDLIKSGTKIIGMIDGIMGGM